MAKLEVFLENFEHEQPLCNILKERVHKGQEAPGNVANIDPYALMFDQVINHYRNIDQPEVVELLQQCLYIKCGCRLSQPTKQEEMTFKRRIITSYVKKWDWSLDTLRHLDNSHNWSFNQHVALSRRIHRFLIQCYRRMSTRLKMHSQSVSKEDMTVLGRRLDTFYSKKEHKLDFLRIGFDDDVYCPVITLKLLRRKNTTAEWAAYDGDQLGKLGKAHLATLLTSATSPVRIILWCVVNRVIDSHTKVLLDYDTAPLEEQDIAALVAHFVAIFPPVRVSTIAREALLSPVQITACTAVVNFTTTRLKPSVEEINLVYSTTWGETYLIPGKDAVDKLWFELQETFPAPPCYAFIPDSSHRQRIYDGLIEQTEQPFVLVK